MWSQDRLGQGVYLSDCQIRSKQRCVSFVIASLSNYSVNMLSVPPVIGIEDLLAAYLEFRQKLETLDSPPPDGGPQLIIMGHGSVDDPDGTVI